MLPFLVLYASLVTLSSTTTIITFMGAGNNGRDKEQYVILGGHLGLCSGRETVRMGQEDGDREKEIS